MKDKRNKGITLIALVVTIIVLLILAGISIAMLSGNNGILQRATDAKTNSEKQGIIEQARIDILGQQAENKGTNLTKEQLVTILNKYFEATDSTSIPDEISSEQGHDIELTTKDEKYTIMLSEIFKGRFAGENLETFGEKYEDSMIGKTIAYTSGTNNVSDWIIIGKQENAQGKNDIIITTTNISESTLRIDHNIVEWSAYETKLNNACKSYVGTTGTLGTKSATIKDVRNITMDDIKNAVGFNETIYPVILSSSTNSYSYPNSDGTEWINQNNMEYSSFELPEGYFYGGESGRYMLFRSSNQNGTPNSIVLGKPENMIYITTEGGNYWILAKSLVVESTYVYYCTGCVTGGMIFNCYDRYARSSEVTGTDEGGSYNERSIRPVVVLSSETPWDDVKDLIGNYATY